MWNNLSSRLKIIAVLLLPYALFALAIVLPSHFVDKAEPISFALYDKNGVLIGASVASDGQWRFEKGDVPADFEKAIILFEDKRFYAHHGIDFLSLFRAAASDLKARKIVSGGSTITMQLARLLHKNPKRTFFQKGREALEAVALEVLYTKKEILSMYSSLAPFGGNVVGLEAASWRYFEREPFSLSIAEYATLAVLPNQPSLVRLDKNSEKLKTKRNALLKKLFEAHYIDREQYELSLAEPLPQKPHNLPQYAPHYLEAMKSSSNNAQKNKVYTSLDLNMQKNAARILEKWSAQFAKKGINNAAVLIIDTPTLSPLAYCANTDYGGDERNKDTYAVDMIQARRSSGSLLKPFLYNAMLEAGQILPTQIVIDIPTRIGSYKPENNVLGYRGALKADEALTRSLNIPAIRSLRTFGVARFLDYMRAFGITTLDRTPAEYGLPLILGGGEVTMWEIVRAYARLANSHTASSYITLSALAEGIRPEGEELWKSYKGAKKIAWKTGTSNGYRDAWAIGVTAEYTVGVWIGNAQGGGNRELKSITTAAPVLFDIYATLGQTHFLPKPTADLEAVTICADSGYLAGTNCTHTAVIEKPASAPLGSPCPYCTLITLTPDKKYRATIDDMTGEYQGQFPITEKWFVLPPALEYYYAKTAAFYKKLPPYPPNHPATADTDSLAITFPHHRAEIIIPTEIDGKKGATILQAVTRDKSASLFWDIDGDFIGVTRDIHEFAVTLSAGSHTLTVTDSNGNLKTVTFTVRD